MGFLAMGIALSFLHRSLYYRCTGLISIGLEAGLSDIRRKVGLSKRGNVLLTLSWSLKGTFLCGVDTENHVEVERLSLGAYLGLKLLTVLCSRKSASAPVLLWPQVVFSGPSPPSSSTNTNFEGSGGGRGWWTWGVGVKGS